MLDATMVVVADIFQSINNWMTDTIPRIPIGQWAENVVTWCQNNIQWLFNWIADTLTWMDNGLAHLFTWPIPLIVAVVLGLLAWRVRGPMLAVFTFVGLLLINNMELWNDAMLTLALVLIAAAIAVAISVPLGILASRSRAVSVIVKPVMDLMQTMPAFVYLIPAVSFFHIGEVPGIVATVIFSMPPAVRLTELGINEVDAEVVEAGHAFGASPRRILFSIQLPLARTTIMAGVNQVIMLALSMVVIAGMIGAEGLGQDVYYAVQRIEIGPGFEAGLAVVILAVILDRFTSALGDDSSTAKPSVFSRIGALFNREDDDVDTTTEAANLTGDPPPTAISTPNHQRS